ncbi:uncharacterized protein LOC143827504 [Paroedura picta]|uniref:uncharacterized protein LOC143827504 n=1 Tax=Paroedura picta TaxID=143630 RepID=UPI004055BFF1
MGGQASRAPVHRDHGSSPHAPANPRRCASTGASRCSGTTHGSGPAEVRSLFPLASRCRPCLRQGEGFGLRCCLHRRLFAFPQGGESLCRPPTDFSSVPLQLSQQTPRFALFLRVQPARDVLQPIGHLLQLLLSLGWASRPSPGENFFLPPLATASSDPYGSMDVQGTVKEDYQLGTNGGYFCDDCKGKKQLEVHTAANMRSSRSKGVARTIWHIFSYTGSFKLSALQSTGTAGWLASKKVLSLLWLAVVSPGKAISGIIWLLGTGWYQFVTGWYQFVISLLNVFILTRCLPKLFKMVLYLIPVFLLIGKRKRIVSLGRGSFLVETECFIGVNVCG